MIDMKTLAEEIRYYTNGHWTPEGLAEYIGENFSINLTEEQRGKIAYALTKRLVIDMPTARSAVDEALSNTSGDSDPFYVASKRVEGELKRLNEEIERLRDEVSAKDFVIRHGESLAEDSIYAIRELLKEQNVPVAAFIDDHVANAIVQRNQAQDRVVKLENALKANSRLLEKMRTSGHWPDKVAPASDAVDCLHLTNSALREIRS